MGKKSRDNTRKKQPWQDKKQFDRLLVQVNGNYAKAGEVWGIDPTTVSKWSRKHGHPPRPPGTGPAGIPAAVDLSAHELPTDKELIAHLAGKGYVLSKEPEPENRRHKLKPKNLKSDSFRLGIVSDTHYCSRFQQPTHFAAAYKYFKDNGISDVIHAGDVLAGNGKIYRGQVYELFKQGGDAQVDYVVDNYPFVDGITTHVIAGNHDLSFMKSDGIDVLRLIADRREDFNYLGHYGAYLEIEGIRIYIHHGEGGLSYARSYKLQKLIEQFSPENKPHILIAGHYHSTVTLKMYRNVYGIMAGCFESQTPYLRRKGLYPEIGFGTLEVGYNKEGVVSIAEQWFPFFVPVENDF